MAQPPPAWIWKPKAPTKGQQRVSENLPGKPLKDFHMFADLIPEVQDLVWEWACHINRRTVTMAITADICRFEGELPSRPSIMEASVGARAIALKHFKLTECLPFVRQTPVPAPQQGPNWVPNGPYRQNPRLIPGWDEISNRTRHNYHIRRGHVIDSPPQGRRFYVNMDSDIFKLRIGETHVNYQYPVANIARENVVTASRKNPDTDFELRDLSNCYTAPGDFPGDGPLHSILLDKLTHLQLKFQLPPITNTDKFTKYAQTAVQDFCSTLLKTTITKFTHLKQVDLTIACADWLEVDYDSAERRLRGYSPLISTYWGNLPIMESDGVSFGRAQLGYIEQELRMWCWKEKGDRRTSQMAPEFPQIRLMVEVREDSLNKLKSLSVHG